VGEQLLEDDLAGGESLRGRLRGLELGALGGDGPTCGRDLGLLTLAQVGAASSGFPSTLESARTAIAIESAVIAAGRALVATGL
jgi:hypothetical protein